MFVPDPTVNRTMFTQFIVLPLTRFSVPKVIDTDNLDAIPVDAVALFFAIRRMVLLEVITFEVLMLSDLS